MNQTPTSQKTRIRVLFVNRMAGIVRGGGETFDVEMSNELSRLGCEVTFLTGKPMFSNPSPSPTDTSILPASRIKFLRSPYLPWFPWDKVRAGWRVRVWEFQQFERKAAKWIENHAGEFDVIQICELPYLVHRLQVSAFAKASAAAKAMADKTADKAGCRLQVSGSREEVAGCKLQVAGSGGRAQGGEGLGGSSDLQPSTSSHQAPMLRSEDEAMQGKPASLIPYPVSRIPYRVSRIPPLVLRLTAPNAHDPWGGIQAADAVIASGTSIDKVRKALRPDVHNVPNGVHLETFAGSETLRDQARQFRERWQIPVAAPVLLYVARFQDFKKHDMLIRSFSLVVKKKPEVRLVLAGSGPLRSELEKQVKAAGLRDQVIMLGEVGFDQLPSIYTAADIKVISSEYESFCFAAVEAMASGLPVVTTDCGWVPGLIGDVLPPIDKQWASGGDAPGRFEVEQDGKRIRQASGGLVVSRTEPVSLTTALLHMIGDAELRKSCGRWNREKAVREHGWESSAKKLLHVYESLLDGEDSYEPRMDGHGWGAG